jgi:hypothetical protein
MEPEPDRRPGAMSAVGLALGGIVTVVLLFVAAGALFPAPEPSQSTARRFAPLPEIAPVPLPSATLGKPAGPLSKYDGTLSRTRGRIEDRQAGLSYAKLDAPWKQSKEVGDDERGFTARQLFVTESSGPGSEWLAEIASMPLDSGHQNLYSGPDSLREVAEAQSRDLQISSFPLGSRREEVAGQRIEVSGRRGWVTGFRLSFQHPRFTVTDETVVVVAVDTGKRRPGILYITIPGTHDELRADINTVVDSLRVLR